MYHDYPAAASRNQANNTYLGNGQTDRPLNQEYSDDYASGQRSTNTQNRGSAAYETFGKKFVPGNRFLVKATGGGYQSGSAQVEELSPHQVQGSDLAQRLLQPQPRMQKPHIRHNNKTKTHSFQQSPFCAEQDKDGIEITKGQASHNRLASDLFGKVSTKQSAVFHIDTKSHYDMIQTSLSKQKGARAESSKIGHPKQYKNKRLESSNTSAKEEDLRWQMNMRNQVFPADPQDVSLRQIQLLQAQNVLIQQASKQRHTKSILQRFSDYTQVRTSGARPTPISHSPVGSHIVTPNASINAALPGALHHNHSQQHQLPIQEPSIIVRQPSRVPSGPPASANRSTLSLSIIRKQQRARRLPTRAAGAFKSSYGP